MTNDDSGFVGSIPDLYDRNIGPLMMVPYAGDIARRLSEMATGRLLEVAAGTGIVTAALALPRAQLIATDLNQLRYIAVALAFFIPSILALLAAFGVAPAITTITAALLALIGLLVERWLFFAEATHVATIYYGR